jgi:hypothetical protein
MAEPLKITKIDSPLARRHGEPESEPSESMTIEPGKRDADRGGALTRATAAAPANSRSAHAARRQRRRPNGSSSAGDPLADATVRDKAAPEPGALLENLWEPPALDEPGELLAARVPVSLVRAMERHTRALRDAHGGASQKQLPAHEVLAAVLWALGDPDDAATTERVAHIHRQYRGRRMAAAAKKVLESDGDVR